MNIPATAGDKLSAADLSEIAKSAGLFASDSGSATAYAIAPSPAIGSYVTGMEFTFLAANANTTTTPTLDVSGKGVKTIKNIDGTALIVGQIPLGGAIRVKYDGTNFQLISPQRPIYKPKYFNLGHLAYNLNSLGYSDKEIYASWYAAQIEIEIPREIKQIRDITSDNAQANSIGGYVVLGVYLYVFIRNTSGTVFEVWRYSLTNLAAGGTKMTIAGTAFGSSGGLPTMVSDGIAFYFSRTAGNGTNGYIISKYSLSGTTLTYVSDTTCGAVAAAFDTGLAVDSAGNYYGLNSQTLKRFDSGGTLLNTISVAGGAGPIGLFNWGNALYLLQRDVGAGSYTLFANRIEMPGM